MKSKVLTSTKAAIKRAANAGKKHVVLNLCNEINKAKSKHGKIPHGLITNLIKNANSVSPGLSITRHDIRYEQNKLNQESKIIQPTSLVPGSTSTHQVGGRPKGTTIESTKKMLVSIISAQNEVVSKYAEEKKSLEKTRK